VTISSYLLCYTYIGAIGEGSLRGTAWRDVQKSAQKKPICVTDHADYAGLNPSSCAARMMG